MTRPDKSYVEWLEARSMLKVSQDRTHLYSGKSRLWMNPYAEAQPRRAIEIASVWLTVYPDAIIAPEGCTVLGALAHEALWRRLSEIGVQGVHTGPIKQSGGIRGNAFTPSVDGNFDRISFDVDPLLGTEQELVQMSRMAAAHNAVTIDDLIPSHTGKGADFRLAELGHGAYPGLYHMVEIREEDWDVLPDVPAGKDAINLLPAVCDELKHRHYIVGQLQRVIFFEPGVKETDWSVTPPITGVDGKTRRWVYLHYFKEGQPSLNWLDPSFAAQQMILGDALYTLDCLGARGLRLDANGFLGVEIRAQDTAWSESHPLSITGNQIIGGMIRKAGGFSFQELNLTLDDIAQMSKGGADLSYDFITRPAYQHALLTGDTEFLRLMLHQMHAFHIDPASLIHALQNHDELTVELVHFWTLHAHDMFMYKGQTLPGAILREHIREEIYERLSGEHAPYNLRFVTNGISCTTVSLITAALGIRDLDTVEEADIALIQKIHLLLVMYNAMQPGVVAISGWDLVGALPLPGESVAERMQDGDTRWIHRGGYDLASLDPDATESVRGMPRARALYGSLDTQLERSDSFASSVKKLLAVRQAYAIASSKQILVPDVASPGLLVMVHELPAGRGIQITALNFGRETISEELVLSGFTPGPVVDMINETVEGDLTEDGRLMINLDPYEALCLRIVNSGGHV
ncbi:maltose alpha-D-glucosyltransferase [Pseudomonas capeferrum]|uniref:maltose alpha-D-glucosyltransferase n=1 Tax=Pseudomonas capeferrum TaxID=1495066 RepID=UPI0015E48145|nr:maltose alpha-D-glucosyltransferase [Pseudomonas capeferrum]MBA1205234.1 maltose alpha-D-glucosyltransferase [Pseudomonas capeferrum]